MYHEYECVPYLPCLQQTLVKYRTCICDRDVSKSKL